jgi:hypothetical protein
MRFILFFIALFVTVGYLLGAPVNNPFPNFCAVIILWFIYYLITLLQDQCMRVYLRNNGYRF